MPKRIMVIYGTRPEAIKCAPVIKAIDAHPELEAISVVTGQHKEMLSQVNSLFEITPDADLDVFEQGQSLNHLSAKILDRLDPIFDQFHPDAVLVQGDTTTVAIAAIAAFYREIPVVHLEAGLRSGNLKSPFPEEANRKLVGQIADLHLAPTKQSRENLLHDGIPADRITVTGNTVIDALHYTTEKPVSYLDPRVAEAVSSDRRILLVTAHRRENWGDPMVQIGKALGEIASKYPDDLIIYPAHGNPAVRAAIMPSLEGLENVIVTDPLDYLQFSNLINAAHVVLTDSGGIQEEAPSLGKPVLVLRENTERPEAVTAGTVKLIGTDREVIVSEVSILKSSQEAYAAMSEAVNPYGDGKAAARSAAAVAELLGVGTRLDEFTAD
ncbi:non-hydrolyzing UDP-N-acetylglucosamine 2-epimerase [Schaalia vaccimaxillae]|uniref:non-hydrolyzing UDP-N-acetylglucosamine 2-epimerase n=1 Tax=Schaalia vaccimaxillae TaxID=183916 RepID=UPI0003B7A361|nr:UDP-N-acetylglucosamine 2-epimerase (non-hydrolyzing) [Schaalia vaccimaxillae]